MPNPAPALITVSCFVSTWAIRPSSRGRSISPVARRGGTTLVVRNSGCLPVPGWSLVASGTTPHRRSGLDRITPSALGRPRNTGSARQQPKWTAGGFGQLTPAFPQNLSSPPPVRGMPRTRTPRYLNSYDAEYPRERHVLSIPGEPGYVRGRGYPNAERLRCGALRQWFARSKRRNRYPY